LVQGVADYVRGLYFHDDDTLVVTMFAPSEVRWDRPGGAVEVVQETDYPATDTTRLTVRDPGNGRFAIKLRVPAWAKGATLAVNGVRQAATPGTLATVSRTWKAGDVVDLVLPQSFRMLAIDDKNPNIAAVMRGPVMYVGLNPWDGIDSKAIPLPGALAPVEGQDQAWRAVVDGRDLVFVPYSTVGTERYNTYFKVA
jgi:DUF1680 family protein